MSSVPPTAPVPPVTEVGLPRTLASPRTRGEGQGSHRRGEDTAGRRERLAAQWVASQGHSPFPLLRVKPRSCFPGQFLPLVAPKQVQP